jgi:transposase InsO family protein
MKYEAMYVLRFDFSVRKMAKVLELKESAYYQWKARYDRNALRREAQAVLAKRIRQVFEEYRCVYGYRKMQAALADKGITLSYYRVRKIMRECGLYPESIKKFRPGHKGKADGRYLDNKVKQNFKASAPNELWAGDITYIKTKAGYVYLATVIDLYSKEIIGYSVSKHIDTDLTKRALANALVSSKRKKDDQTIFHSDKGMSVHV